MENKVMTPEEFENELLRVLDRRQFPHSAYGYDLEMAHFDMDRLMCKVLRSLGYGAGIDVFEATKKLYA